MNLTTGKVEWYEGNANRSSEGLLWLAGKTATTGQIGDALDAYGFEWRFSGGGAVADTRRAFQDSLDSRSVPSILDCRCFQQRYNMLVKCSCRVNDCCS